MTELKERFCEFMNGRNDTKKDIRIDNIDVRLKISFYPDFIYVHLLDRHLYESYTTDVYFSTNTKKFDINEEDINETYLQIYDYLEQLKNYKYCNINSEFRNLPIQYDGILDEIFGVENKCCVCLENVGIEEHLICFHKICRHCRHKMIRKNNKKCPICRKKNLCIKSQEDDDDEDDEE